LLTVLSPAISVFEIAAASLLLVLVRGKQLRNKKEKPSFIPCHNRDNLFFFCAEDVSGRSSCCTGSLTCAEDACVNWIGLGFLNSNLFFILGSAVDDELAPVGLNVLKSE